MLYVPRIVSNYVNKTNKMHSFYIHIYLFFNLYYMFRMIVSFIIRSFLCFLYSQLCTKSCKLVQLLWFSTRKQKQLDTYVRLCTEL